MTYSDLIVKLWGESKDILYGEKVIWIYRTYKRMQEFGEYSDVEQEYLELIARVS